MNVPTISPIKNIALLIALAITGMALAGCGNKGPLVKPSDIPAPAPAASTVTPAGDESAAEPVAEPVTEPEPTPAAEPASGTPAAQR